jgi:cell division FtsZ-interacting protein ZapD
MKETLQNPAQKMNEAVGALNVLRQNILVGRVADEEKPRLERILKEVDKGRNPLDAWKEIQGIDDGMQDYK